ncbi:CCR4-NOT transcription complex subunit 6 [Hypsibius exemplaris]|uniref:CCR4-NOT transcription complex subunit 6 n=1 Tax=Hypsibius exemplaris TaxID=2072580 RepID=A0A1W0WJP2_HYPEX|nr:CCR4-NOT transcription complex subunit 6 [Hypsibius exemplaris]
MFTVEGRSYARVTAPVQTSSAPAAAKAVSHPVNNGNNCGSSSFSGVPLISYAAPKKKRRGGAQNGQKAHRGARLAQASWSSSSGGSSRRGSDYLGEPLLIIPRGSQTSTRGGPHYFSMGYATYGQLMGYHPEYYQPTQQLPVPGMQHRESFSSMGSSAASDSTSSGSASPVHFAHYWDQMAAASASPQSYEISHLAAKRDWIQKASSEVPEGSLGITLRIMSYNILAEQYATKKLYPHCPAWALSWQYRRERIREDMEHYAPDIACLQEVPMGEFYGYFLQQFQVQGYSGIFKPKSRAKTMDSKYQQTVDGCCIIFRHDRFELIHQDWVEFNQLAIKSADGSTDMLNRVMTKDNIALCAVFRVVESAVPSYILAVNAHVHWDPEFSDVKLIQTMLLMNEVEKLVAKTKHDLNVEDVPIVFCGDLNSLPDSGVVEFLRNGRVSSSHADFKDLPYRSCLQKLSSSQGRVMTTAPADDDGPHFLHHPFALSSVYDEEDMPFTNFTSDFKGVIDYVFVSRGKFQTVGVLGALDPTWLEEHCVSSFPCPQIPSDHLPLVAEIELIP